MFNQFTGIGNLAADPEIRHAQSGTAVATYTVCCDYGWGDNKGTEFLRCVSFGKLAGIVSEYLHKGSKIMVQGEIVTRKWEDKDGNTRYSTECKVQTMKMLSPKGGSTESHTTQEPPMPDLSDVPF